MTVETFQYLTVPASESLARQCEVFIDCFDNNPKEGQGPRFVRLVEELTKNMIQFFLIEPASLAKLPSVHMKLINVCSATGVKVSSMMTGKIYNKKKNDELVKIANYCRSIYTHIEGEGTFITLPMDKQFAKDFQFIIDANQAGDEMDMDMVVQVLNKLTEDVLQIFLAPTEMVEMSGITKKLLTVGVGSVEKSIHAVIGGLVHKLDGDQFKAFMEHYSVLLKEMTEEEAKRYA